MLKSFNMNGVKWTTAFNCKILDAVWCYRVTNKGKIYWLFTSEELAEVEAGCKYYTEGS